MLRGKVTFKAPFPEIQFESIEFAYPDSKVLLATVKSSPSEGVILVVEIIKTDSVTEIFTKAQEVADYTAKKLTFKFNILFQSFRKVDENIVKEEVQNDGSKQTTPYIFLSMGMGIGINSYTICTTQQLSEVKECLEQKKHDKSIYYNQFYSALNLKDSLSKFMALYSIALSLCGDNQDKVDQFILSFQPSTRNNTPYRPRKSGVAETIYTRLRNEIGHIRPHTTIEQTRQDMEENLNGLILIVKELISRQT